MKTQEYSISGTVAVGQTLTVAKSGDNNVADSATYKWQSSSHPNDPTAWSDITGATSYNYTITRNDRYKYLRAEVTYTMTDGTNTLTGNIAHTEKTILVPLETELQQYSISGTKVTGTQLSVEKVGDDIIPASDDQYTTYQWQRYDSTTSSWNNISGATNKTFIPDDSYAGKQIKALVTYNMRSLVYQEFQAETAPVTVTAFDLSGFTWGITGDLNFQKTLTANIIGSGVVYSDVTKKWQSSNDGNSSWTNIGTGNTYTIKGKDQNKYIRVVVTYKPLYQLINREYNTSVVRVPAFVNQDYTIHETDSYVPNKTVANSTSQIGKTLSVFTRRDPQRDIDGEEDTTYQWQRYDGIRKWDDITGATKSTYKVMSPDENKQLRAKVTFNFSGLGPITVESTNNVSIEAFNMGNLVYGISGTVEIGQYLSVTKSGNLPSWMPAITNTQYGWQRSSNGTDWSAISSETNSAYKVMGPDEGKYLRAKVTFTISSLAFTKTLYITTAIVPDFVLQDYIVTGQAENGKKLTVNETTNKLPVGTIDSISYQWQCSSNNGSSWTNVGTSNEYTVIYQNKLTRVKVTFGVSSLQITKVVTVNVSQPYFIILGLGKDAVILDDYDLRDVNLSHTRIESMDNVVVNDNTNFTRTNLKGLNTTTIKNAPSGSTLTITTAKQSEIDFSKTLRSKSYDLSGKDLRGYDLTGMKITSLKDATINSTTNLSLINAQGC